MNYDALIVASGKGERAKLGYNKVFYCMKDGKTVLEHAASLFMEDEDCKRVIIVTNEEDFDQIRPHEKIILTKGGEVRSESVRNGLKLCESEYVFIHDGARPFLHEEALRQVKEKLITDKAVILGRYAIDTIKVVEDGVIKETIDRNKIFLAETPQAFDRKLIEDCYEKCEGIAFTDDASLAEALGYKVSVVNDEYDNRKLTKEEDFRDL